MLRFDDLSNFNNITCLIDAKYKKHIYNDNCHKLIIYKLLIAMQ